MREEPYEALVQAREMAREELKGFAEAVRIARDRKHVCRPSRTCTCSIVALDPDEGCPVHGYPWPPRCETCGRFLKWRGANSR